MAAAVFSKPAGGTGSSTPGDPGVAAACGEAVEAWAADLAEEAAAAAGCGQAAPGLPALKSARGFPRCSAAIASLAAFAAGCREGFKAGATSSWPRDCADGAPVWADPAVAGPSQRPQKLVRFCINGGLAALHLPLSTLPKLILKQRAVWRSKCTSLGV